LPPQPAGCAVSPVIAHSAARDGAGLDDLLPHLRGVVVEKIECTAAATEITARWWPVRAAGPGRTGPTGSSWPRWPACCPPGCATTAWSRPARCWPGTAEFLGLEKAFDLGWIPCFRSPANQAAQESLVSGDATAHEDSALSVDVDAAYALAQATGLLPDDDKCQAYIADVHSAFRSGS
jgi:hypothetical protein